MDGEWMEPMKGFKFNTMKPLLESQGIEVTMDSTGLHVDVDVSGWRNCYEDKLSLLDAQARYLGVVPKKTGHMHITEPWIKVSADENTKGRVIFNRTPRYRNLNFPWGKILKHFGNKSLFIGTDREYEDFLDKVGPIERYETENCLKVAEAIQGADFFVGNQSSSFWITAALQKPLIQEVFPPAPNSVVEYEGATYCLDGNLKL